ncbi:hypothetical protein [Streptomyces sp. NPDC002676]
MDTPAPHPDSASPERLAYFDDEPAFVRAAAAVGLHASLFTHAIDIRERLCAYRYT